MAVTKDKKRRTPHSIKAATLMLVAGFLLSCCSPQFKANQATLQKKYWDNVLRLAYEKHGRHTHEYHFYHYNAKRH